MKQHGEAIWLPRLRKRSIHHGDQPRGSLGILRSSQLTLCVPLLDCALQNFDVVCEHNKLAAIAYFMEGNLLPVIGAGVTTKDDSTLDGLDAKFAQVAPISIPNLNRQLFQRLFHGSPVRSRGRHLNSEFSIRQGVVY